MAGGTKREAGPGDWARVQRATSVATIYVSGKILA